MLNLEKKFKEESKLADMIEKLRDQELTPWKGNLKAILDESIH